MTDDDKTPDPTPALLPPARLAEIRERARLSSLPHVAELLAHLDALTPRAAPDGEALGAEVRRIRGEFTWGEALRKEEEAEDRAIGLALHAIGHAAGRSEGEAERLRLADEVANLRLVCSWDPTNPLDLAEARATIARLTAELAEARAALAESEAHAGGMLTLCNVLTAERDAARRDGAREERREWSALLAIVDRITFDAPDDKPNGPGEQAIDDMSKALEVDRWPSNVRSRIADLNGHMATLCDALADDCRDLKAAADALRARGEDRPPCPGAGWEWDAFALQWFQPGAKGKAIAVPNRAGGAGGAG